jgi:hypothetical protein
MQSALCCLVHDPKRWYIDMFGPMNMPQEQFKDFIKNFQKYV